MNHKLVIEIVMDEGRNIHDRPLFLKFGTTTMTFAKFILCINGLEILTGNISNS